MTEAHNKLLIAFGKRLREVRLSKEISQENLALEAGFDRTYLSLLERGKRNPSLVAICRIAQILETDPHELLMGVRLSKRRD